MIHYRATTSLNDTIMRNEPTWDEVNDWSVRKINKYFRSIDESHLYPICGKFNATERAIRRLRKFRHDGGYCNEGLEYYLSLEREISNIVNDPRL